MKRSRLWFWNSLLGLATAFSVASLTAADRPDREKKSSRPAPPAKAKDNPPPRAERSAPPAKIEAPRRVEAPRNDPKPAPRMERNVVAPKIELPRKVETPRIDPKRIQPVQRMERNPPKIDLKLRDERPKQLTPPVQVVPRQGGNGAPKIELPRAIEVKKPDPAPGGRSGNDNTPRRGGDTPRSPRDDKGNNDKGNNQTPKIDLPGRRDGDGNKGGVPGGILPKPGDRPRGNDGVPGAGSGLPGLPGRDNKPGQPGGRDDKKPGDGLPVLPGPRDRDDKKPDGGTPVVPELRDRDNKKPGEGLPGLPGRDRGDGKPGGPGMRDRDDKQPGDNLPGLPGRDRGDGKPGLPGIRDRDDNKPGLPGVGPRDRDNKSPGIVPGVGPGSKDGPRDGLPGMKDRDGRPGGKDADESLPRLPGRGDDGPGRDGPGRDGPGRDGPGRDDKRGPGGDRDRDRPDFTNRPVKQIKIDPTDRIGDHIKDDKAQEAFKNMRHARNADQLQAEFAKLRGSDAIRNDPRLAAINLDRVSGRFQVRVRDKEFDPLVRSQVGQRYQLDRQFQLLGRGDVARQMRFNHTLVQHGGWQKRHVGPVFNRYTHHSFSAWYPGPRWYPRYCWQPVWSPWVRWSFWTTVMPIYDPRPFIVRPIYYDPCPPVVVYQYPVWQPLPVETAGTWVDAPQVVVDQGNDLQLLAVRFVDPGHKEENLGPRFRVWLRNNSNRVLQQPIDVTLFASNDQQLATGALQAGVTLPEIPANEIVPLDIRLPMEVNQMGVDQEGNRVPFQFLHAVVDSRNALPETDKANNGAILDRGEIYPVDPAAFSTDVTAAAPGTVISLAGEGLGPEPGEIIVTVGDQQQSAEIRGWYDLGVQFTVPNLNVASAADAQIIVIRGDGAASNPVPLNVAPESMIGTLPMAPVPGGAAVPPAPGPVPVVPALNAPLNPIE